MSKHGKTKASGKIKSSGKTQSGGRVHSQSQINAINVSQGIAAEKRVLDTIHDDYRPRRVTRAKTSPDFGIPDIELVVNGQRRLVEVKSVREGNRAQFRKSELRHLARTNDLVVFEVRKSNHIKDYYLAKARAVYVLCQDEQGEEVKVEYSQITAFEQVNPDNPLKLRKIKPSLQIRFDQFLGRNTTRIFTYYQLRKKFSEAEIAELLREPLIYRHHGDVYQSVEAL